MSCISKLGAPSMSRSSTETGAVTPSTGQPNWILHQQTPVSHAQNCPSTNSTNTKPITNASGLDRMSVCSSHGSYGSNSSEYSVPRMVCQTHTSSSGQSNDSWYEHIQHTQELNAKNQRASGTNALPPISPSSNTICKTCPPNRPPKSKLNTNGKPPMPLPITEPLHTNAVVNQPSHNKYAGPYKNYDIPRPTHLHCHDKNILIAANENYDTPKKIQDYLAESDQNSNPTTKTTIDIYGNYDVPAMITENMNKDFIGLPETDDWPRCGIPDENGENGATRVGCTCNKVMSWADSWISLPYCRRGNGIENTGVPINKVKLSGEGRMPVVQPSGELAVYATVDMTKKIKRRLLEDIKMCECDCDDIDKNNDDDNDETKNDQQRPQSKMSNYINIEPMQPESKCENNKNPNQNDSASNENYMNLDFALSLKNYENAKVVLQRAGFSVRHIEETLAQCVLHRNICQKCGHTSKRIVNKIDHIDLSNNGEQKMPEDYILMEPSKKKIFPGYLPMSPAAPNTNGTIALSEDVPESSSTSSNETVTPAQNQITPNLPIPQESTSSSTPPLPIKSDLMKRLLAEKSGSNQNIGPAVDRSKKRAEQETRIPGSAMMSSMKTTGGSPYIRKQLMDSSDRLPRSFQRKRSSSADSTRLSNIANILCSENIRKSVGAIDNETLNNGLASASTSTATMTATQSRRASSPCLHADIENCHDLSMCGTSSKPESLTCHRSINETETDDEISLSMNQSQTSQQSQQSVYIRRSASVPCKAQNRDSSSSNDSGVSTGSMRQRNAEYTDFELPLTTVMSTLRHQRNIPANALITSTLHASLPRRSKSFDPLREINFQFSRKFTEKSTSAEAEIPLCAPKTMGDGKVGYASPNDGASLTGNGHPYIDSRSTSSGTSDMSDYIETLSLSSHSSSDTPEGLR